VHDLDFDTWNMVDGLEVKPVFSPHPVETNVFIFRALWEGGYHSYGHFADVSSFRVLQSMLSKDDKSVGISQSFYDKVKREYLSPVDLKKIDIGGGLIHGDACDFKQDESKKIILAHTSLALSDAEKEIGSDGSFGSMDHLIPTYQNYGMRRAYQFLSNDFKTAPSYQLQMLLNNQAIHINPGTIMIKSGEVNDFLYLVLSGSVEMIDSKKGSKMKLYAGALLGELSALQSCPASHTYRTESFVKVLKISSRLYCDFVRINDLYNKIERLGESWQFLEGLSLFDESISHAVLNDLVQAAVLKKYPAGHQFDVYDDQLYLIKQGKVHVVGAGVCARIEAGDFFGEEAMFAKGAKYPEMHVSDSSDPADEFEVYQLPLDMIRNIPILNWKLFERHEKRKKLFYPS